MVRWEYKIVHLVAAKWTSTGLSEEVGVRFDELGNEGWELVRVEPVLRPSALSGSYTAAFVAFFKRPREE